MTEYTVKTCSSCRHYRRYRHADPAMFLDTARCVLMGALLMDQGQDCPDYQLKPTETPPCP